MPGVANPSFQTKERQVASKIAVARVSVHSSSISFRRSLLPAPIRVSYLKFLRRIVDYRRSNGPPSERKRKRKEQSHLHLCELIGAG